MTNRSRAVDPERAVRNRYTAAAQAREAALCCPVDYDPQYPKTIPKEVIERDYGCGDPSRYVREGDVVLDLGSGSGKICFIASQIVGPKGAVIGVDMNEEMLLLARSAAEVVGERLGYANVHFARGRIQDLALDVERVECFLRASPVLDLADFERLARTAVCAKTFGLLTSAPYANETIGIEPRVAISESERHRFLCDGTLPRDPRETKGMTCLSSSDHPILENSLLEAFDRNRPRELLGRPVAEARVRSLAGELLSPVLDQNFGVDPVLEPLHAETFIPELPVERFVRSGLPRLPRVDQCCVDLGSCQPPQHRSRHKPRAHVRAHVPRSSAHGHKLRENVDRAA